MGSQTILTLVDTARMTGKTRLNTKHYHDNTDSCPRFPATLLLQGSLMDQYGSLTDQEYLMYCFND